MKKMLFVVDYQNDFVSGTLGTPESKEITSSVKAKISAYRSENYTVIFTQDTHYDDTYFDTQEGRNLPIKHCIKNTWGWQIADGIAVEDAKIIEKETFGIMNLSDYVPSDIDCVEIIGVCTDICVVSNALILKSQRPELLIQVDASCCAGLTPENHTAALTVLASNQVNVL
ncbi:cysteine hydrolase [Erysipelothrix sp. HDW6C]|uniref:cysteine hydrolase family protein n=1 Tax=Erysipelothrix sp. HDW6C TaxID=2714930 RepID=UPI00140C0E7B|nr:isochorismatase family cysteine hydrolase [Erysipelothrix sp. HDW6C]QIK70102.1 cysteine hydrolase [Erysipelothrix sp. HDW6C]